MRVAPGTTTSVVGEGQGRFRLLSRVVETAGLESQEKEGEVQRRLPEYFAGQALTTARNDTDVEIGP